MAGSLELEKVRRGDPLSPPRRTLLVLLLWQMLVGG
jgi:hypothetical protein